ncbi:FecR family protein [Myroides odoratimimus]|uniref:FecR family protein n=1 Tax=Myroides odoratimimus TaxID=76832 RepID=UPI001CE1D4BB|nr:FecR domain-containing protein [Myroides odoratimimus]MCA4806958.1 FecR family protein [Myroides odoratimimus]
MDDIQFRTLLKKASQGKLTKQEESLLDQFVAKKQKDNEQALSSPQLSLDFVQNKVLENTLNHIKSKNKTAYIYKLLQYVAIIIIGLLSCVFTYNAISDSSEQVTTTTIIAQTHQPKIITLPDSSTVVLSANSVLSYNHDFNIEKRTVKLKGKAFFDIAHNKQKPFTVEVGDFTTSVLGTSFTITEIDSLTQVTVVTGKVKVSSEKESLIEPIYLTKNKQFTFNNHTQLSSVNTKDLESVLTWNKGIINFKQTPLPEVINQLNTWYNTSIQYNSSLIKQKTLTASYNDKSLDYILEDISFLLDLKINKRSNIYYLTQNK